MTNLTPSPKLITRFRRIEGLQTVDRIMKLLNVSKSNAIRIIHELRKRRLAQTIGGGPKRRLFRISSFPHIKEQNDLYNYLNKHSGMMLSISPTRIISKNLTPELAIVESLSDDNFRVWIAALALFRKDIDWDYLSFLAIEKEVSNVVGAFYDAARKVIRVRKMPLRVRKRLLKYKGFGKFQLTKSRNKDFKEIELVWKVGIPFSKQDVLRLKK